MLSNVLDYRTAARRFLPSFAYWYLEGGAEDEVTLRRNRTAYQEIFFSPRVFVDVADVDTSVEVAGRVQQWPAVVGPTGFNGIFRRRADESLARQANAAGVPFVLSTASTSLIESVRDEAAGDLWFQLYVNRDRRIAEDLMRRARQCGYGVLLVTVDTPVSGQRDHYRKTGFTFPPRWTPKLAWDALSHPRWLAAVGIHGIPRLVNLARSAGLGEDVAAQMAAMSRQDTAFSWADMPWLRQHWPGRIYIKGIQRVADAVAAHRHGADGVVLSNHGGRQLDGSQSPVEILADTVQACPGHFEVLIDSGVRRGSDIVKALALGARAVLLGRAPLYGLAAEGEQGCADVLALLRREMETCLRLIGCPQAKALDRSFLTSKG